LPWIYAGFPQSPSKFFVFPVFFLDPPGVFRNHRLVFRLRQFPALFHGFFLPDLFRLIQIPFFQQHIHHLRF
jgi:hypothetical protein